jgi:molybdopterin adenylyltransferase
MKKSEMTLRFGILTVSDRSSRGVRPDSSGPALQIILTQQGWQVEKYLTVPDEPHLIREVLLDWSESEQVDVILTTGGTGFSPRDITPEATLSVVERQAPGLAEAMRAASLRITPHAMLSRAVAGIHRKTLIINLPGSPKAAVENLETILLVLPHAVQLIHNDPASEAGHQLNPGSGLK